MTILAETDTERNSRHAATLAQKAGATRSRRAKAGKYPTKAHKEAMSKLLQRNGEANLTAAECLTLSTHPILTPSQRSYFAALATK